MFRSFTDKIVIVIGAEEVDEVDLWDVECIGFCEDLQMAIVYPIGYGFTDIAGEAYNILRCHKVGVFGKAIFIIPFHFFF